MAKKGIKLTMDELVVNAKNALKGKQVNTNSKELFEKTLKKAVKPRGSK